jgi:hypothetical protein
VSYFPDLGTVTMATAGPHVRAIGWLDADYPYPTGRRLPAGFTAHLHACAGDWTRSARLLGLQTFLGWHSCEFCTEAIGFGSFGIPADDILFVAPDMVGHYVATHRYMPPEEFIMAVLQAPAFDSPRYAALVERFRNLPISEEDHERIGEASQSWVRRMRARAAVRARA